MPDHYFLESGWCICGHHRDDGRRDKDAPTIPSRDEIRALLDQHGPTYQPKERTP